MDAKASARTCMLVPVHAPHFDYLAHRVAATAALSSEPTPPMTVAVFDDEAAVSGFCSRFPAACDNSSGLRTVHLHGLLGDSAYQTARARLIDAASPRSRCAIGGRCRCRGGAELPTACAGCRYKQGGRVYQALKKYYGVAFSRFGCDSFWVSDAETYPFRKFNFTELIALSGATPRLAQVPRAHAPLFEQHTPMFEHKRSIHRVHATCIPQAVRRCMLLRGRATASAAPRASICTRTAAAPPS